MVSFGARARLWSIDPDALQRSFWLSTPRCPEPDERQRVLAWPRSDAERAAAECLAMQACLGRPPALERYDACLAELRVSE